MWYLIYLNYHSTTSCNAILKWKRLNWSEIIVRNIFGVHTVSKRKICTILSFCLELEEKTHGQVEFEGNIFQTYVSTYEFKLFSIDLTTLKFEYARTIEWYG